MLIHRLPEIYWHGTNLSSLEYFPASEIYGYSGNAGDIRGNGNSGDPTNAKFSTYDRDNDKSTGNCAGMRCFNVLKGFKFFACVWIRYYMHWKWNTTNQYTWL